MDNRWLIVFTDPEPLLPEAGWRDRLLDWGLRTFLHRGFRHVFAVQADEDGLTVVDPKTGGTAVVRHRFRGGHDHAAGVDLRQWWDYLTIAARLSDPT